MSVDAQLAPIGQYLHNVGARKVRAVLMADQYDGLTAYWSAVLPFIRSADERARIELMLEGWRRERAQLPVD